MDETVQLHALIEGRVQGVGFRYFVRQQAATLPLTGWVRNLSDGRVEIVAEGQRAELEKLLGSVQKGPTGSLVTNVDVKWKPASHGFNGFAIRPTG